MRANKRFLVGRYLPGRFIPFRKPLVVGGGLDRRRDGSTSSASFTPTKRWPRGREREEERMKQHVVALFQFRGKRRAEFKFGFITGKGKLVSTNQARTISCCCVEIIIFFLIPTPSSFYPCEHKTVPFSPASQHQQPSYPTPKPQTRSFGCPVLWGKSVKCGFRISEGGGHHLPKFPHGANTIGLLGHRRRITFRSCDSGRGKS